MTPSWRPSRSSTIDLAGLGRQLVVGEAEAEPGDEVDDRDDLAAQADHAAHAGRVGVDGARRGVADDLAHAGDRERVLVPAQLEDDELDGHSGNHLESADEGVELLGAMG